MENQDTTTPSQSQRLLACGVSPATADKEWPQSGIPAWSLYTLLYHVLPNTLDGFRCHRHYSSSITEFSGSHFEYTVTGNLTLFFSATKWHVDYSPYGFFGTPPQSRNPIEAIVLAIELLYVNGYQFNHQNRTTMTLAQIECDPRNRKIRRL